MVRSKPSDCTPGGGKAKTAFERLGNITLDLAMVDIIVKQILTVSGMLATVVSRSARNAIEVKR